MELAIALISTTCAVLSILFCILTYGRKKQKDKTDITIKLTKMESDILYIRERLDERKKWEADIEKRLRKLENKS